jgi:hypothetical protein
MKFHAKKWGKIGVTLKYTYLRVFWSPVVWGDPSDWQAQPGPGDVVKSCDLCSIPHGVVPHGVVLHGPIVKAGKCH